MAILTVKQNTEIHRIISIIVILFLSLAYLAIVIKMVFVPTLEGITTAEIGNSID